jgi:hypothetical protein
MGPNGQTLLYDFSTLVAFLCREARVHSDHLMTLLRNDEMFLVFMQIAVLAVLPELNRVPLVALLEARESHTRNVIFLGSEKPFERFGEAICEHLIIDHARLHQALHEQVRLFFIRIEAILKRSHANILLDSIRIVKCLVDLFYATGSLGNNYFYSISQQRKTARFICLFKSDTNLVFAHSRHTCYAIV